MAMTAALEAMAEMMGVLARWQVSAGPENLENFDRFADAGEGVALKLDLSHHV
jgi:hypothetical protein